MRLVFLDTETTGLDAAGGDRVVEIGCIEMVARRLTGEQRHYYLNPQRTSHPDALRVHGLSDAFLAEQPRFEQVADELLAFVAGAELVIHNAGFDVEFLDRELQRCGREPLASHVAAITDSLQLARALYPGKHNSLDALCRRLGVDASARTLHGALLDAELLADVYLAMTRGQDSLEISIGDGGEAAGMLSGTQWPPSGLRVEAASAAELAEHAAMLEAIGAEAKGQALWSRLEAHQDTLRPRPQRKA